MGEENLKWGFAATGFLYALIFAFLGFNVTGSCGTGTFFFFAIAVLPYGIGLLFWPVMGYLMADLRAVFSKWLYLTILAAHYFLVVKCLWYSEESYYLIKMWNSSPSLLLMPAIFYLTGQVVIWAVFIRSIRSTRERAI